MSIEYSVQEYLAIRNLFVAEGNSNELRIVTNCKSLNKGKIYIDLAQIETLKFDFYAFLKENISENYK